MTPREFREWAAYARLEPIGGTRGDYQAALIASTIANVHRGKGQPARKIEQFLMFNHKRKPAGRKQAGAEMVAWLRSKKKPAGGTPEGSKKKPAGKAPDGSKKKPAGGTPEGNKTG